MDIKPGRNWALFAAGIALIIIGFILLMVPGLTLVTIAILAGCMFVAACDLILGVLFIAHPVASAVVIPWVMGIFVIAYGVFGIVASVRLREVLPGWGWVLFSGIVSVLCGFAFIIAPGSFALFLGLFLMARGAQMAVYGVTLPQAPTRFAHNH